MVFLFLLALPTTSAAHSQILAWGYDEGQAFYFNEQHISNGEEVTSTNYLLKGSEYSTIKDPLTTEDRLPMAAFDVFWPNGSLVTSFTQRVGINLAVPIGNWSLLSTVLEANLKELHSNENESYTYQLTDTTDAWGYSLVHTTYAFGSNSAVASQYTYSKNDGVLQDWVWEYTEAWSNTSFKYVLSRLLTLPETQAILTTSLAIGILVIVLVAVTKRRKRK